MESKNQKIVLHNYMLVAVNDVTTANEKGVRESILTFKQTWASPASSLFTKVYKIKVNSDQFDSEMAIDMLSDGVNDSSIVFPGYVQNGQLTLLAKLEPSDMYLKDYETIISTNLVRQLQLTSRVQ